MANPLPNSLALTTINDNAQIVASDHRNNYSAIQSAANLLRACLAGGVSGQLLQAVDGTDVQWVTGTPLSAVYRKTTPKQVVNTVAATDLTNGEITVAGNVMSTNRVLRLTAWGDMVNNTGSPQGSPRWQLALGTSILDTGVIAASWGTSATRYPWRITAEVMNLGAANSQWSNFQLAFGGALVSNLLANFSTGKGIYATNASDQAFAQGGGASAIDTTTSKVFGVVVILPVASANCDVTLQGALVEVV